MIARIGCNREEESDEKMMMMMMMISTCGCCVCYAVYYENIYVYYLYR